MIFAVGMVPLLMIEVQLTIWELLVIDLVQFAKLLQYPSFIVSLTALPSA